MIRSQLVIPRKAISWWCSCISNCEYTYWQKWINIISFKIAVNDATETYGSPSSTAAFHVLNILKDYNKIGQLKKELSALYMHKYTLDEACAHQSQAVITLAKLRSHGIKQDRLISSNNFLERSNGYINNRSSSWFVVQDWLSQLNAQSSSRYIFKRSIQLF
jgi:hypothetical protein